MLTKQIFLKDGGVLVKGEKRIRENEYLISLGKEKEFQPRLEMRIRQVGIKTHKFICSLLLGEINYFTLFHTINDIKAKPHLKKPLHNQWMMHSEITSTHMNYVFKKTKFGYTNYLFNYKNDLVVFLPA